LTNNYKHIAEITTHFKKAIKTLDQDLKKRISEKIEELLNGKIVGKPLKGRYKGIEVVRIGKYRLIYSREPCKIILHDVRLRETAYI
jgi:addiction module RelE/StbE family toxin